MRNHKKTADVCLSPALYELYAADNTVIVLIDAIRASATICTALMNDVEFVLPVSDVEEARSYGAKGYIIAGERDGEKIKGFDFGNSPSNFSEENIKGKKLAYTTTNGTQVVDLIYRENKKNIELLVGSFINITALVNQLVNKNKNILILCSGWKNTVNVEDTLLAGRIIDLLKRYNEFEFREAAGLAHAVYLNSGGNYYDFVLNNSPRIHAKSEILGDDITYCLTEDITKVVPYLKEGKLIV